jgi:hypothetical protein
VSLNLRFTAATSSSISLCGLLNLTLLLRAGNAQFAALERGSISATQLGECGTVPYAHEVDVSGRSRCVGAGVVVCGGAGAVATTCCVGWVVAWLGGRWLGWLVCAVRAAVCTLRALVGWRFDLKKVCVPVCTPSAITAKNAKMGGSLKVIRDFVVFFALALERWSKNPNAPSQSAAKAF